MGPGDKSLVFDNSGKMLILFEPRPKKTRFPHFWKTGQYITPSQIRIMLIETTQVLPNSTFNINLAVIFCDIKVVSVFIMKKML